MKRYKRNIEKPLTEKQKRALDEVKAAYLDLADAEEFFFKRIKIAYGTGISLRRISAAADNCISYETVRRVINEVA